MATGQTRLILGGLPCRAQSLVFSPDGRWLALGGRSDAIVALHDTATGAEVSRLVGHCGLVRDIAFSPDGHSLATAGADRSIKLWDLPAVKTSVSQLGRWTIGRQHVDDPEYRAMRERHQSFSIVVGLLAGLLLPILAEGAERSTPQPQGDAKRSRFNGEARALAATIDRILAAKWTEAKATPAPQADDAEFLRRVALDLTGKIPDGRGGPRLPRRPQARQARASGRSSAGEPRLPRQRHRDLAFDAVAGSRYRCASALPGADVRSMAPETGGRGRRLRSDRPVDPDDGPRYARAAGRNPHRSPRRADAPGLLHGEGREAGEPRGRDGAASSWVSGSNAPSATTIRSPRWKRDEFWGFASFFAGVTRSGPEDGAGAGARARRPDRAGDSGDRACGPERPSLMARSRP